MSEINSDSKSNIELPIKKTTGETLEERMSENAYKRILPARYQRKDKDGNIVESQEEVFERVAKNISLAESLYEAQRLDKTITVTPTQVKNNHTKREKLVEKVFGERIDPQEAEEKDLTEELTEHNIKYFSYDNIVPELDDKIKQHVKNVKENFQEQMEFLKFTPNTPTIVNAGDELQMLAACFVDSPEDDMQDIHQTAEEASLIFQGGGGIGYGVWRLRPKGDTIGSTGGGSSGPISFMRTYDQVCGTVEAGGVRRGAQMSVMRVSHPDVLEFIHSKDKDVSLAHELSLNDPDDFTHNSFKEALQEAREILEDYGGVPKHLRNAAEGHLSNFNISVGITDGFMQAVKNNENYTFTNPRTEEPFIANEKTVETYEMFGLGEHAEEGEVLSVPARKIWKHIIQGAHENGEPGVVYLERMNKQSSFDHKKHPEKQILSTNPCGEEPLFEYDACNLSHINLSTILDNDCSVQKYHKFKSGLLDDMGVDNMGVENIDVSGVVEAYLDQVVDWDDLDERIHWNTRFLDNVVTMCDYPIPEIEDTTRKSRKIGLGVMGFAQMLIQMGISYGSKEANEVARQLMDHINNESIRVSHELAVNEDEAGMGRGVFEDWDKSKWSDPVEYKDWFEKENTNEVAEEWSDGYPIRNHTTTTLAPTGTTSMIGNTTGGCEPLYNVANFKNVSEDIQGDDMLRQFDDFFLRVLEANDIDVEDVKDEAVKQMNNNEFKGVEGLETVPDGVGELFVTTQDLSAIEHASVQCAFQEGVSSAISKTINAPNDASVEDAMEAFEYIYDNGGKGVTYYRDGTRSKQVLTTRRDNKEFAELDDEELLDVIRDRVDSDSNGFVESLVDLVVKVAENEDETILNSVLSEFEDDSVDISEGEDDSHVSMSLSEYRKRPDVLVGATRRKNTPSGDTLYVTLNEDDDGKLFEVFAVVGKSGGRISSLTEGLCRLISLLLRYGCPPDRIVKHLSDIKGPEVIWDNNGNRIHSIPDALSVVIEEHLEDGGAVGHIKRNNNVSDLEDVDEVDQEAERELNIEIENCPDCDGELIHSEGCVKCGECGWSRC